MLLIFAPHIQSQNKRTSNRYSPMPPSHRPHCNGHDYYERFQNMNLLAKQICEMDTINLPFSFRVVSE